MAAPTQPQQSSRGKHVARWAMLVVSALFWAFALASSEGVARQKERLAHREELRHQLAAERAENDALRREVEGLRGDDLVIEQAVRSVLDYQRPGEIVLVVEDDDPLGPATPVQRATGLVAPPLPQKMLPKPIPNRAGAGLASPAPKVAAASKLAPPKPAPSRPAAPSAKPKHKRS